MREADGIQFLLRHVSGIKKGYRSAQLGIGTLVEGTNAAMANNTVSIVVTGPLARDTSQTIR